MIRRITRPSFSHTAGACSLMAILFLLLTTACQSHLANPPRLATATAQAALAPTATVEPAILLAPSPTPGGSPLPELEAPPALPPNPVLRVWVNETSAEHEAVLKEMVADLKQRHQIDVALLHVAPLLLPDLVKTAVLSDTLPDVILHPLEYSVGWAERGIFDTAVTDAIIDQLGRDTFDPDALALLQTPGGTAAIPSEGYQQLLIYRADWIAERGLATPDNYQDIFTLAEAVYDLENVLTGFIIPTESNLTTTHQAFEHIALANGCQLINENGQVLILEPACQEALDFYFNIVHQFSPPGVQTDTSARNAYLAGRTAMIMAPPSVLPMLAGLDSNNPPRCPECAANPAYLAQNSGIVASISGPTPGLSSNFGQIHSLGFTQRADPETAALFAAYWFNEGYPHWLSVESERKVPMRWGTAEQPRQFIDAWGAQPLAGSDLTLVDIYGPEVVAQLGNGVASAGRWGLRQGWGSLITSLYEDLTLSIVLQEMLSGYFTTGQTIIEAYNRITNLIPNYQDGSSSDEEIGAPEE